MSQSILPDAEPTSDDAVAIVRETVDQNVLSIERFGTGLRHYVYDVVTREHHRYVVRISHPRDESAITGSLYWSRLLRRKNIPLPLIIYEGLDRHVSPFQFVILERLPGDDLEKVYPTLSLSQKREIASAVVGIESIVGSLPLGTGFGHVFAYESGFPFSTWEAFIRASLNRSRSRLTSAASSRLGAVDRVEKMADKFTEYFRSIAPIPFLDDLTTKNVIVENGKLTGIVDVDSVCFGDSLLTLGLTQTALLAENYDLEYVNAWRDLLGLSPQQADALRFYTALFCVDFMSEAGLKFNRQEVPQSANDRLPSLDKILESILADGKTSL